MGVSVGEIYECVLDGDQKRIVDKVQAALDEGLEPETILNDGMVAAMAEAGQLFEDGEFFVPEMLIAARAMKAGMDVLRPLLVNAELKGSGKVVVGTVQGDLHDIGKNLVCMLLEGASFEIVDLGADVPPEKFVEAVQTHQPDIVAMSALLTTTMPNMKTVIEELKKAGLRDQVKVMVGGAPLSAQYAESMGADGYAPDGNKAVALAKSLIAAI